MLTDVEYQILKNQINLMSAVSLLMTKAVMDEPELQSLAMAIAKAIEQDAIDSAKLV